MSRFVTDVADDLVEKCGAAMHHNDMDFSCLIVHAQQVEVSRIKRKNRDSKRASPYDKGTYKVNIEIQDKQKFKKRLSNQVLPNVSKAKKNGFLILSLKGEKVVVHKVRNPLESNVARGTWVNAEWEPIVLLWKEWSHGEIFSHGQDSRKGDHPSSSKCS